jgi:hypothetical protein
MTLINSEVPEIQNSYAFTAPWSSGKNPDLSQWYHQNVNYLTCHVFETSLEVRTEQKQFLNYTR